MTYLGLDPELARQLSLAMRQADVAAEDLGADVIAAMTLSELESVVPGQLGVLGDELGEVGVIVSARADLVEGFAPDPVVLAKQLGFTKAQIKRVLAAFDTANTNTNDITPFFDLRAKLKKGREALRGSFLGLPPLGQDPVLDEALDVLGPILPRALARGKLKAEKLTKKQGRALKVLSAALGLRDGNEEFGDVKPFTGSLKMFGKSGAALRRRIDGSFHFATIAMAFELDQRLASAAGLPTIKDIIYQANVDFDLDAEFDKSLRPLNRFLPALLVGEGEPPTDVADRRLTVDFARELGFDGSGFKRALAFLRGSRFLQRALIPGDFEDIDGPLLVWTDRGVNNALLAGRRNGVLDDVSREQAEFLASSILADDGSGDPVDLTDDQTQALAAIVIGQNGEDFVLDNPQIQRQLMSAVNLIGRQSTLDDQRRLFASSIEAFRSLAVVGAPSMTYRQLKAAVGQKVSDELSYKDLTARSEKAFNKRPQLITLLNNWGVPGGDTLKLKKRKFSFSFNRSGRLTKVRNKKLSRWKRFKNTIKAIGKALKNEWKNNPWGVIWQGVKIAAGAVLTVVPGTNAVGASMLYTALTVLVADMAYQASNGNWKEALASGITALSGGAAVFGTAAKAGGTASTASKFIDVGEKVFDVAERGGEVIDAIEDGDLLGAITSGTAVLAGGARVFPSAEIVGSGANLVATGAEFVGSVSSTVDAGIEVVEAIDDGEVFEVLSSSFNLISAGLDTAVTSGQFANSASSFTSGSIADQNVLDQAARGDITADVKQELENDFTHRVVSSATLNSFTTVGDLADDASILTAVGGAAINGDFVGAARHGVEFLRGAPGDEQAKLAVAAAEKGVAVAEIVEQVYDGGAVPEGEQLFTALFELGAAAGAAFVGPRAVAAPPEPLKTVAPDGSILVDYDNDGVTDAILSNDAAGRGVVALDLDGDGSTDVSYTDTNDDGRGDIESGRLQLEEDLAVEADLFASVPPERRSVRPIVQQDLIRIPEHYSLSELAAAHGISTEALLAANTQIVDPNRILAGGELALPEGVAAVTLAPRTIAAADPDPASQPLSEFQATASLADNELEVAVETFIPEAIARVAEIDTQVTELAARQAELKRASIAGERRVYPFEILDLRDEQEALLAERQHLTRSLTSPEVALRNGEPVLGLDNQTLEGVVAERERLTGEFESLREQILALDPSERPDKLPEVLRLRDEIEEALQRGVDAQRIADAAPPEQAAPADSLPFELLRLEVRKMVEDGRGVTQVTTVESGGPSIEGQLTKPKGKLSSVSVEGVDTELALDSRRVSSFAGEEGQMIVGQKTNATFGVTGVTGSASFGEHSGGITGGIIRNSEFTIDRVETIPEHVGANGELPSTDDPTNLPPGTTATKMTFTQPKDDLGLFGVVGGALGAGIGVNGELSADETPVEGTIEIVTNSQGSTTEVATGEITNSSIVEMAIQAQGTAGLTDESTPPEEKKGLIHGSASLYANLGGVREVSTGDVSLITTSQADENAAAIESQLKDGTLTVESGGKVTVAKGDFRFEQTILEAGVGAKAEVKLGSENGVGTTVKETLEGAYVDRVEISNTDEDHLIFPTGADGTSSAIPDDAFAVGHTKGTTIRNDNEFSISSEQHRLPGFPEVYRGGDETTENSVTTHIGSVSGTNRELSELAQETLEKNPTLRGNDFLQAVADGATVADAAINTPNHPLTDLNHPNGQVTSGSEALVAEHRLQQLQQLQDDPEVTGDNR